MRKNIMGSEKIITFPPHYPLLSWNNFPLHINYDYGSARDFKMEAPG